MHREGLDSNIQLLAGGGRESKEGEEKLGKAGHGNWQGGSIPQGITDIFTSP